MESQGFFACVFMFYTQGYDAIDLLTISRLPEKKVNSSRRRNSSFENHSE